MHNLKVGHFTHQDHGTGVTVFLFDSPARGAYVLCGSSPASHEIAVLELEANVSCIDALTFVGGSAYGLSAVAGVLRWCKEKGRGYQTPYGVVPIVPAAGIFDLSVQSAHPPNAEEAYRACQLAVEDNAERGRIGAGTGASVGKLVPNARQMYGGLGQAVLRLPGGLEVVAYAVVNSLGDIRDKTGRIIAGAFFPDGSYADCEAYLLSGGNHLFQEVSVSNTALISVFTNAGFSKIELKRIAKVAISGMARAISPVFMRSDGDILFCVSLGELPADEKVVSVMAAEAVRQAIVNAVQDSVPIE